MSLPPAQPRSPEHLRQVVYNGYRREDGLWDIEAHLCDTKHVPFEVPGEISWAPHEPIHDMEIRLTVDQQLVIREIAVAMNHVPHDDCPQTQAPMQKLVGYTLGAGWRRAIDEHLGNVKGCTHLRELLFNMATAAFQTVSASFAGDASKPPPHLGRCLSWGFDTPLVERRFPMFFQWPEKSKQVK